jgi:hypothetical protein
MVLFLVGKRVQTTQSMAGVPCGSSGTIRQVFPAGDFCDVRFDHKLLPRLVPCQVLELEDAHEETDRRSRWNTTR